MKEKKIQIIKLRAEEKKAEKTKTGQQEIEEEAVRRQRMKDMENREQTEIGRGQDQTARLQKYVH